MKYEFLKNQITTSGDKKVVEDFNSLGRPPYKTFDQIVILSRLLWKYGGSFYKLSPDEINQAVSKTKEYNTAKLNWKLKATA